MPILTDGQPHNISLDVVSAEDDHTINQNWFVSGLLQVVTDPSGKPTTGKITHYDAPLFAETDTTGSVGTNGDVNVTVSASRKIHIEAEVTSGSGKTTQVPQFLYEAGFGVPGSGQCLFFPMSYRLLILFLYQTTQA